MKYNVGDLVVFKGDLELLFNPFYKDETRRHMVKKVTEADEKFFTIYNEKGIEKSVLKNAFSCGMYEYMAFMQSTGMCYSWTDRNKLLHLEKDKDEICSIVMNVGRSQFEKDIYRYENEIESAKSRIERAKEVYALDVDSNCKLLDIEQKGMIDFDKK